MSAHPPDPARPGGPPQPDAWQRAVTRWAAVLGGAALVLLIGLVVPLSDSNLGGNLVNAVVAGANVAFVIFTWAVFKAGQDQLAQLRHEASAQHEAWRREYGNALDTYREAVRARLDQSAPRVSVTFDTWTACLVSNGRATAIRPGTSVPEGPPGLAVRLATRWVVRNWGTEPVVVRYPRTPSGTSGTEDVRVSPSAEHVFHHEHERAVGDWQSERGRWRHTVEVLAEDLGGDVLDTHTWTREITVFDVGEASRLTLRELDVVRGSVAKRRRDYPGLTAAPGA
ncbi:hypothetical protein [Streptomyces sp. NPDC029674]|uniref:hypothetical protein n=1 Tax=Streptomyces sp. NPDC029674 TaxID=3365297 RepID=UPI00384F5BE8